jgi:hypothetical protein
MMDHFFSHPESSINAAMGKWSEAKAAYRIFDHENLTEERILESHRSQVTQRAAAYDELLLVQDTTTLCYTSHVQAKGLGSIAQGYKGGSSQGLFVHTTYVLGACDGVPLGLLDQQIWSRDKIEHKHPQDRWRLGMRQSSIFDKQRIIHVADREADFWDLMSEAQVRGESFVIRLIKQRGLKPTLERLFKEADSLGEIELEVNIRLPNDDPKKTKFHKRRTQERICLQVRQSELDLRNLTSYFLTPGRAEDLRVNLVWAVEKNPPSHRSAIEWVLKTNLTTSAFSNCQKVLEIYAKRWSIEQFHKALKSGCLVEKARLATADRLKKYITAMSIVAWRLAHLTYYARAEGETLCSEVLSDSEWKALYCKTHKSSVFPPKPPTTREAIRWIAQLGGFLGRKSDGEPGMITLWRGWNKLTEIAELYEILESRYG